MKEKLINIVQSIKSCADDRKGTGVFCVARIRCTFNGKKETYWLTSSNNNASYYGLNLNKHGHFVPKVSEVATQMQSMDVGSSFEYSRMNDYNRMRTYRVVLENQSDFQNQTIRIAGDKFVKYYQFRDIKGFLKALQQNKEDILDKENEIEELLRMYAELKKQKGTASQRANITKTINALKEDYRILTQQQEDLKNITIYIRKQGEMRYSLIVDTKQTRIKSQNLFDGKTIVIDGGPGTGKSTTMIHRLAYLTSVFAIEEDRDNGYNRFKLSPSHRSQLLEAIKNQRDWMFFSPSQMLRDYLSEAMGKEGLTNISGKVWCWKDYCQLILQENYRLLESTSNKAPFKKCKSTEVLFYQKCDVVSELLHFYLSQLRQMKSQLPELLSDGPVYEWMSIARSIKQRFDGSENYNLAQFVSLFHSLESVYGNDCKRILRENSDLILSLADEICEWLDNHTDDKKEIENWLEPSDEDGEDDTDEEQNVAGRADDRLAVEIQKWIKVYSRSKISTDVSMSDEHQIISELLLPLIEDKYASQIQKIGELIIFEQFAKCTRGVSAIMLNGMGVRYKNFRKHLIAIQLEGCNLNLLSKLRQTKSGKELHYQEQSLLLGFINNLVKQIKTISKGTVKHVYMDAYTELARPIIGIDEATDFSVCDIYAMQSLLTREFNSLTLCGDMMQRLTTYGIQSWEELNGIIQDYKVEKLERSYRQSVKLLEVAKCLYEDTIGETPRYKAFLDSRKVPEPLVLIDRDESSKVDWISKRIEEVFRHYGEQLPSIAIFVNDKGYIPKFIDKLQNTKFFKEHQVQVVDGSIPITQKIKGNYIGVYPIEVVKGMEFDVVFFHNLDNSSADPELLKRYIYVGVSRAAFFLAITLIEDKKEISKYFQKNKDWFKI